MAVRKSGERWTVEFMQRGVRVFRRLPAGRTKADAQQLESKLRGQIFNAVDLGKLPDPLLLKVIDEWLETKKQSKAAKQTASHASAVRGAILEMSGSVGLSRIVECANLLLNHGAGLRPATINRRLCVLKAVAKYAYQKGYVAENLSAKITLLPENNARHVYLTQAQVDALIKAAEGKEAKAFIAIAAYTGMRQGEILKLSPSDITAAGLAIRDSKIGTPRIVPYLGDRKFLAAIPFKSHKRTLYAAFEAAREAIGVPGLHYHDLRHTTASMLINSGADLYTVGNVLGHKSTQTTKRYAHMDVAVMRAALERAFPIAIPSGRKNKGRKKRPKSLK